MDTNKVLMLFCKLFLNVKVLVFICNHYVTKTVMYQDIKERHWRFWLLSLTCVFALYDKSQKNPQKKWSTTTSAIHISYMLMHI